MLTPSPSLPPGFGQGKRTVTLLTEGGCFYPVISNLSYVDRQRAHSAPQGAGRIRGLRPMHKTTFLFGKAPWNAKQAYQTTSKQVCFRSSIDIQHTWGHVFKDFSVFSPMFRCTCILKSRRNKWFNKPVSQF